MYGRKHGQITKGPQNVVNIERSGSPRIVVKILGDRITEPNETLFLNISVGSGLARIKDGQAMGTIRNDD